MNPGDEVGDARSGTADEDDDETLEFEHPDDWVNPLGDDDLDDPDSME